jgi:hypothetical protein
VEKIRFRFWQVLAGEKLRFSYFGLNFLGRSLQRGWEGGELRTPFILQQPTQRSFFIWPGGKDLENALAFPGCKDL